MDAETRRNLQEKATTVRQVDAKIVRLKMKKRTNKDPKKQFSIDESIRTHQQIRRGLVESFWGE